MGDDSSGPGTVVDRRTVLESLTVVGLAGLGLTPIASSARQSGGTTWPQYRGGPYRHGTVDGSIDPSRLERSWSLGSDVAMDGEDVAGLVADRNRIYVVTASGRVLGTGRDGSVEWSTTVHEGGEGSSISPPVLTRDHVALYAQESGSAGNIVGIAKTDGSKAWSTSLSPARSSNASWPLLYDGVLYVVRGNTVTAIDLDARSELWSSEFDVESSVPIVSAAPESLVYNRHIQSTPSDHFEGITGIDYDSGEKLWAGDVFNYAYDAESAPVVAPDRGNVYVTNGVYMIRCFDLGTGALQWTFQSRDNEDGLHIDNADTIPAYDGEALYTGGHAGIVYSIDAGDGTLNWRTAPGHDLETASRYDRSGPDLDDPVIVASDHVFVRVGGSLFALDRDSGDVVWQQSDVSVAAANGDGLVLQGTMDGTSGLHLLGPSDGSETASQSGEGGANGTNASAGGPTGSSQPGFSLGSVAAGVTGALYMLRRTADPDG